MIGTQKSIKSQRIKYFSIVAKQPYLLAVITSLCLKTYFLFLLWSKKIGSCNTFI